MANYITRPAIDRKAGKTDIEQLMPYLKNELETVRSNDNAKIAALTEMESNAMANPEAYRGTEFHIDSSGFTNMNDKAKSLMRPKDGIDYSQDAINESSDVINRELTDQLTTDAVDKIANTEERRTAAADAKNIGQLDKARLAQLALDGKDSQGNDLLKDIATPTPPATQPTEGSIATTQPSSTGSTLTAEQIAANNAEQSDPNFTGPTLTAEQIAANNAKQSDSNVLKTGTAAEKANALAQANKGMGAAAKDSNSKSESTGEGRDWTITTDIGVGKSNIKTDAVHDIKTTTRQGIIDQDAVDLKSLKVAAGIESIRNRALAGRPGATPITTVANRLQAREAFLTDIQNKRGVVTSTKQTGGNVDAGLGEMNAKFTAKTGVDQRDSTVIRNDNSARLTNPSPSGDKAPKRVRALERKSWNGRDVSSVDLADDGTNMVNDSGRTGEFLINGQNLTSSDYTEIKNKFNKATVSNGMRYIYVDSWGSNVKIAIPANETFESFSKKAAKNNYMTMVDPNGSIRTANKSLFGLGELDDTREDSSRKKREGYSPMSADNN